MKSANRKCFTSAPIVSPGNSNGQAPDSFIGDLLAQRRSMYQRALFLAQDRTAADDLLQETMEKALQSRHRFEDGSNLGAWLFSIMRNLFIDGRRRRAVHLRLEQKAYWMFGAGAASTSMAMSTSTPMSGTPRAAEDADSASCGSVSGFASGLASGHGDDSGDSAVEPVAVEVAAGDELPCGLMDVVAIEDVKAVVATLAPAQREIFTLAYGEHLTYREIAVRLGIPVSTTGTRLLRVRAKVRARLERLFEQRWRDYTAARGGRG